MIQENLAWVHQWDLMQALFGDRLSTMMIRILPEVDGALQTLNERDADVIRRRFGLDGSRKQTLRDIGRVYDLTGERIRQVEAKALRRLRHATRRHFFVTVDLS